MPRKRRDLKPGDPRFLIVAYDEESIHLYQLCTTYHLREQVVDEFKRYVLGAEWEPFGHVDAYRLDNDEVIQSLGVLLKRGAY